MENIITVLRELGLEKDESALYIHLLKSGKKTATELSRESKILRTKIYRLLELLKAKGLIRETFKDNNSGRYFEVNSYDKLNVLVTQKERELQTIKAKFPKMLEYLDSITSVNQTATKVFYYTGTEGLKQIMWNSSKAKGTLRLYELLDMDQYLDYGFYEDIRLEYARNNLKYLDLGNRKAIPGYTNIRTFVRNCVECRYVDPKRLTLDFEFIVYNDVYAMYEISSATDIFCLEIHDQNLADMQKQIFDFIWNNSTKMTLIDDSGAANIEE